MDYFSAIKTFIRVTELGSLTRAAQELSIKTSTASRQLKDLEADLRIALFNRSTRGLSLTEGGKLFYARTSAILTQLQDARDATSALNLTPSGVLRVTMPNAFGQKHVVPFLGAFLERYRDIDVEVVFSDDTLNLIESRIDVGIRIGNLGDSSLMARRLADQHCIACATPAYLGAHGTPTSPAAMAQQQCLLYSRGIGNFWFARRRVTPDLALEAGWQKVEVSGRLTMNDSEALFQASLASAGIALLPTWLAYDAIMTGQLTALLPEWDVRYTQENVSIWAVYPPKKTVSSKVRSFIDFLIEKYGDAPYWNNHTSVKPDE